MPCCRLPPHRAEFVESLGLDWASFERCDFQTSSFPGATAAAQQAAALYYDAVCIAWGQEPPNLTAGLVGGSRPEPHDKELLK